MDHYDEDLYENAFFKSLCQNREFFEHITSNRWMIAVPRCGTLNGMKFTQSDFETHIFMLIDDRPTAFVTVNQKEVTIKSNLITTSSGFDKKKTVAILFEETFFNKNDESYRVLCVSQPLEGSSDDAEECIIPTFPAFSTALYSLEDCAELLWGSTGNINVKVGLERLLKQCISSLSGKENLPILQLNGIMDTLFQKAIDQVILKDPVLKKNVKQSADMKQSVYVAAEIYLTHNIHWPLFRHICAYVGHRDAKLNKITRNLTHQLQLKDLNISFEFSHNIPRARKELSNLSRLTSPLGKLNCLRRVVNALARNDGSLSPGGAAMPMCTDDLLPILIFLVVKTEMPTWWAQLTFMKSFRFVPSYLDGEFKFYLATLEAALEHVTSNQLMCSNPADELSGFVFESSSANDPAADEITKFFQLIIDNRTSAIEDILTRQQSDVIEMKDFINQNAVNLCHPLCTCEKCGEGKRPEFPVKNVHSTVFTRNDCGYSALHVAALFGRVEITELLINQSAVISASEYRGLTPLHLAAQRGHQAIIVLLLHHNPSCIGVVDKSGNTALHWAALNGQDACVKALVYINQAHGLLNLDEKNEYGDTALHLAAKWSYESIVDVLLETGASPTIRNRKNQQPSHVAFNHRIVTKLNLASEIERRVKNMQQNGSASKQATKTTTTIRTFPPPPPPALQHSNSTLSSSLQRVDDDDPLMAAVVGVEQTANGGDYVVVDGPLPVIKAEAKIDKLLKFVADGDIQMVKYHLGWLELEADYVEMDEIDVTQVSLCHPLCQCNKCQLYQKLTQPTSKSGLHVNSCDTHGFTLLHVATFHGHIELIKLLLCRGADPCSRNITHGSTALHLACQHDNCEAVSMLISYGAQLMDKDNDGNTPLHICCLCGHESQAMMLLKMGAEVNAVNNSGDTPLHLAVRSGFTLLAARLVDVGADVTIQNMQALTPWQSALTTEMKDCLKLLLSSSKKEQKFSSKKPSAATNAVGGRLPRTQSLSDTRRALLSSSSSAENTLTSSDDAVIRRQAKTAVE